MKQLHLAVELIETNWRDSRVLVIGDVMLDRYIGGQVSRISPEAPVPVVHVAQQRHAPGGAANVAMNIAALGAKVTLFGFAGDDDDCRSLLTELVRSGIDTELTFVPGMATTCKLRVISGNQQIVRLDFETVLPRSETSHAELLHRIVQSLNGVSAVILSDYGKGVLSPKVCQDVIRACRDLKIPVLVDPKGRNFDKYRGATTICPNRLELSNITGITHDEKLLEAGKQLVDELELDYLTVTLSEKGIALVARDKIELHSAVAKQVFDVSGAGDTVIAVLALAIGNGIDINSAIPLANVAAGVVVGKVGTVPVTTHELLAALGQDISISKDEKVLGMQRLLARVAEWRAAGNAKIVLTNGCFDVLHVGHVTLLEEARRLGTKLVVAVNSDRSVHTLKGPSRPVVREKERAQVLAALAAVDAVVIFDEDTPIDVIKAVRPDVLVKGGDYSIDTIVGAPEVIGWGGEVVVVPTVEGFSTTRLLERAMTAATE